MQSPNHISSNLRNFLSSMFILFNVTVILFPGLVSAQPGKDFDPRQLDLKQDEKSIRTDVKERKGCCKIKYTSGGYDFFLATEEECRANMYFERFLGDKNSLCFQWKE